MVSDVDGQLKTGWLVEKKKKGKSKSKSKSGSLEARSRSKNRYCLTSHLHATASSSLKCYRLTYLLDH